MVTITRMQLVGTAVVLAAAVGCGSLYFAYDTKQMVPVAANEPKAVVTSIEPPRPAPDMSFFTETRHQYQEHINQILTAKILLATIKDKDEAKEIKRDITALRNACTAVADQYNAKAASLQDPAPEPRTLSAAKCK